MRPLALAADVLLDIPKNLKDIGSSAVSRL